MEGSLFRGYLYIMDIVLTKSQLNKVINESKFLRYSEGEEYGIPEQIDWLMKQKEFMFMHSDVSHKLKLVNNIIHNLQKIQGR